jgi:hypothetical protein
MDKITLSTTLVNQIMAYLGTRPFQEVFQLIQEVQKEAQQPPAAPTLAELQAQLTALQTQINLLTGK